MLREIPIEYGWVVGAVAIFIVIFVPFVISKYIEKDTDEEEEE